MFTLADVVHLIQYYYLTAHKYENVIAEVEAFQLESLRGAPLSARAYSLCCRKH
jgi:hypothetical protein